MDVGAEGHWGHVSPPRFCSKQKSARLFSGNAPFFLKEKVPSKRRAPQVCDASYVPAQDHVLQYFCNTLVTSDQVANHINRQRDSEYHLVIANDQCRVKNLAIANSVMQQPRPIALQGNPLVVFGHPCSFFKFHEISINQRDMKITWVK